MPLYEYRCGSCGRVTEALQSFSDPPLTVCETCGGALAKLLSAPGIHFKGSGWYVSDYARAGSEKKADGAAAESKGEGGGESKAPESNAPDSKVPASKPAESAPAAASPSESKPAASAAAPAAKTA